MTTLEDTVDGTPVITAISIIHSIPRIPRDNLSRDIPPNTIRFGRGADLLRSRLVPGTFIARRHSHNTLSQALARPLRRRLAAAPDPNPAGLGELGVVVQVGPEGKDDLGDARAEKDRLAICFVEVSLLRALLFCKRLTQYSHGTRSRHRA